MVEMMERLDGARIKGVQARLAPPRTPAIECADCGDDIPRARLAALPSAERCVGCQEARERGGRA